MRFRAKVRRKVGASGAERGAGGVDVAVAVRVRVRVPVGFAARVGAVKVVFVLAAVGV